MNAPAAEQAPAPTPTRTLYPGAEVLLTWVGGAVRDVRCIAAPDPADARALEAIGRELRNGALLVDLIERANRWAWLLRDLRTIEIGERR